MAYNYGSCMRGLDVVIAGGVSGPCLREDTINIIACCLVHLLQLYSEKICVFVRGMEEI